MRLFLRLDKYILKKYQIENHFDAFSWVSRPGPITHSKSLVSTDVICTYEQMEHRNKNYAEKVTY